MEPYRIWPPKFPKNYINFTWTEVRNLQIPQNIVLQILGESASFYLLKQ